VEDGPPSHNGGGDDMQSVMSVHSIQSHHSQHTLQTQGGQSYASAATQGTQHHSPQQPPPGMHEQEIEHEQLLSWGSMFGDVALVTNRNYFTTTVARGKRFVLRKSLGVLCSLLTIVIFVHFSQRRY